MAAKTNQIGTGYTGTPNSARLIGEGYLQQQEDRGAIVEVVKEEHYLVPGSNYTEHGRHLAGSAVIFIGATEPTQRPNASDSLGALDVGRLWLDTTNLATGFVILKVFREVATSTYAWREVFQFKVWENDTGTWDPSAKIDAVLADLFDQVMNHDSNVTFAKVTATEFVGSLTGVATKIRTSAPTSPAAGDIWVI